jgi:predicted membrane channel-forming protein YqfA (hemolysin III family)
MSAPSFLAPWHEFYALLGTAAAALVALLFVAVSIATSVLTPDQESRRNTRTFISPVVFHYANILFLSLTALVPTQTWQSFGLVIGLASIGNVIYASVIAIRVHRSTQSDLADRFDYGAIPVACYASGLAVAALLFAENSVGLDILAGAALLLLVINIRNAWDLMVSLARRVGQPQPPPT